MDGLRQYVISVTTAALICGIVSGLVKKGGAGELIRMLCGLMLAIVVLRPIGSLHPEAFGFGLFPSSWEGESMAAQGEKIARQSMTDIIKSRTEAYILDKAAALEVSLAAKVTLSEDDIPVPVGVTLSGNLSPYARSQLTDVIAKDLGIPKENQLWTGGS